MSRQAKTQNIIDQAYEILSAFNPMTVRQVYYQLVSRYGLPNKLAEYKSVSRMLVSARLDGSIPWEWLEDRTRVAHGLDGSYDSLEEFATYIQYYYKRDFWSHQGITLEVWEEKDALSAIFADALSPYRVTYNVGRGFDGWDSIYKAAQRYGNGENIIVLYFGDFDPSGEEMCTSLKKRLAELGSYPTIHKVALTQEDVERYQLPHNFTKATDSRQAKFVEKYGDMSVELDSIPPDVLQARIREEVEKYVDMDALAAIDKAEAEERKRLMEATKGIV